MSKKRVFLVRMLVVLVLLVVAGVMLIIGRGHTIYFENRAAEYNGTTAEAPYKIEVFVKGERVAKLYDKERGMSPWMGQDFKMTVEVTEEKGGDASTYTIGLKLPYNMDGIILNIPALLEGLPEDVYLTEFIPTATEEETEEEAPADEFGIGDDMGGDF